MYHEGLLLIGVVHNKKRVRQVKQILDKIDFKGQNCFTEFDNRPEKDNDEFFNPIVKFLLSRGAFVLHEINEVSLTKLALAEYRPIYEDKYAEPIRLARKFHSDPEIHSSLLIEAQDEFLKILGKHRDPNIIKLIIENNPIAAIMGDGHAEAIYLELQAKLNKPVNYIKVI